MRGIKTATSLFVLLICIFCGQIGTAALPPYYPPRQEVKEFQVLPKKQIPITIANGLTFCLGQDQASQSLNGDWKISGLGNSKVPFAENVDEENGYWRKDYDDRQWDTIKVPLNWVEKYKDALDADRPYVKGWYRKQVAIPKMRQGQRVLLKFDVIGYDAKLFVNGAFVGNHHGDFTPWEVDITDFVVFGQENTIALRVLSDYGPGYTGAPAKHCYGSQWGISDVKGGIWQNVSIRYVTPIYFQRVLVDPQISGSSLRVKYWVENNSGEEVELPLYATVVSAMDGKSIPANLSLGKLQLQQGMNKGEIEFPLKNPQLWDPDHPYLYYLALTMATEEQIVATHTERFGYREFHTEGKYFYLNNQRIYLFGENLPSVWFGGYGRDEADEAASIKDQLLGFKSLGYNIVRNPHMPILPIALEIADELGMMIYNEWGWSFTTELDKEQFEEHNLGELEEWIYRDYNNPSVVMWSLGNEVRYDNEFVHEQLNKQVALVRELDGQGRPISSFSGLAFDFGSKKLETDVLDLHTYVGLGSPWTSFEEAMDAVMKFNQNVYGENGQLDKPFIVWECVGFSWGHMSDPDFVINDVDLYEKYAKGPTSLGEPNGIGYAGTIGLEASLDPERGINWGKEVFGKRIIEFIRYNDNIQGFAPWFQAAFLDAATNWNQPLYCGLRSDHGLPPKSLFAGEKYKLNLFAINSQDRVLRDLKLEVSLFDQSGNRIIVERFLEELKPFEKLEEIIELEIPLCVEPGNYQLRLTIAANEQVVSTNFYNIFIQGQEIFASPLQAEKTVAVLAPNTALGEQFVKILTDLEVKYEILPSLDKLYNYEVFVIPPSTEPYLIFGKEDKQKYVFDWVDNGGTLMQFEQNYFGETLLGYMESAGSPYIDLVTPKHPLFQDLNQLCFDQWDNTNEGKCIYYAANPFTTNALAVRAPFLGGKATYNAVAEGTQGNGQIFMNQLCATELWGIDSAASTFMRNILAYYLTDRTPRPSPRPWVSTKAYKIEVDSEDVIKVDLRPYVTRGFKDDVAGDQLGGWTDQGNNDFRMMPTGERRFCGIPFDIIDPEENHGKSCIVLKGEQRAYFPEKVDGIAVNRKFKRIFFMHTAAWVYGPGKAGVYIVNYEDGSSVEVPLQAQSNIDDWWSPGDLPQAKVGFVAENPVQGSVGAWVFEWENPKPDTKIDSIDFVSSNTGVVPVLIAISGEIN